MSEVIKREQVMGLLLSVTPSYKEKWEEHVKENYSNGDEALPYIDIANFSKHIVYLFKEGNTKEFPMLFDVIEELHINGDEYVKELATIGLLEDIQHNAIGEGINPTVFEKYLRTESKKWWRKVNDFWEKI